MDRLPAQAREPDSVAQTTHVREMAANLLLGRALQMLDAAGGLVVFWDADGRWNKDSFALPGRPDRLEELAPDLAERDVYLCGPPAMTEVTQQRLRHAGVPRRRCPARTGPHPIRTSNRVVDAGIVVVSAAGNFGRNDKGELDLRGATPPDAGVHPIALAVNPATNSIFVPNEDGRIYRWNLVSNSLTQFLPWTPGRLHNQR